ncbi:MAG: response regulator, partial [Chloroflexota bacterium]
MKQSIRVLVVDDHPVYRDGLITMLRSRPSNIEVIGEASDGAEAVAMVGTLNPHVVLMDIKMAGMDGIEATRQIKQLFPDVKVLALSAYEDDDYVLEMVKAGASGYMLKDADNTIIISGIEAVHEGKARIHPRLAMKVFQAFAEISNENQRDKDIFDGLTEREIEILRLIARGMTNRQVSNHLWISERTVDNHVQNIYKKLNISDRTQATLYAVRKGIISINETGAANKRNGG